MAKQKQKQPSSMKAGSMVRVPLVRFSKEKPAAAVKFKVVKADKEGNVTVRATARGEKPIFVKQFADNGSKAGVRGDSPVAAKDSALAFDRAVKRHWA
jgi:hypothetical protein